MSIVDKTSQYQKVLNETERLNLKPNYHYFGCHTKDCIHYFVIHEFSFAKASIVCCVHRLMIAHIICRPEFGYLGLPSCGKILPPVGAALDFPPSFTKKVDNPCFTSFKTILTSLVLHLSTMVCIWCFFRLISLIDGPDPVSLRSQKFAQTRKQKL